MEDGGAIASSSNHKQGYESPLRLVLQCGRPPGCAQ
eukprot:CAMPEP_0119489466 /NCGR_PEP_ID=MMETSP1344-20130328/14909_1 /TAXON_ID=236787 /ORGANISM="Florenciella parvula, Strain CCMP2471" /LENGTH=35 /DNA_ID= /DNA_START= /DNA_END= /DNA_ORIENTATION=